MNSRSKTVFLILLLFQGLHSIEEYLGNLWTRFPPVDHVTRLLSESRATSFLLLNIGFFVFGIWCWLIPVRGDYNMARSLVWFWILVEILNGIGHSIWALYEKAYVPGILTAPFLLGISLYLMIKLRHSSP
ncbi:MAG: HXXEE domain-containing protein [Marinifilaceae bacterium]